MSISFVEQLNNFEKDSEIVARYIYAEMSIRYAASKSKKLLNNLNKTPAFWLTCNAAFQTSAYISLGRIFDKTSKYNIDSLLNSFENNLHLFQRDALAERKRKISKEENPSWLNNYLNESYYPSKKDVKNIRDKVENKREIYTRVIKKPRNKYIAHREKRSPEDVKKLFSGGTVDDLWKLSNFLLRLSEVLWNLYNNGNKPNFSLRRYSVKKIYESNKHSNQVHEEIVKQIKYLMQSIEKL